MKEVKGSKLVRIYAGTEVNVIFLKGELEANNISAVTRDDFGSSVYAGFVGGVPSAIDLFIQESDLEKAEPIVNEFIKNMDQ